MIIPHPDQETLANQILKFKALTWPDRDLVKIFMDSLGIIDIVELEFCLNSRIKRERDAAMKMVKRYLDDLSSGEAIRWADAKDSLHQIYYKVDEIDILQS